MKFFTKLFLLWAFLEASVHATTEHHWKSGIYLDPTNEVRVLLGYNDDLLGHLGVDLPGAVHQTWYAPCMDDSHPEASTCIRWGDFAELANFGLPDRYNCQRLEWTSAYSRSLTDCYDISSDLHWYGGGELYVQRWPIETQERSIVPFITGDHLNNGTFFAGGVLEKYWLVSNGVAFFFDEDVPLYYSITTDDKPKICFTAKDDHPFPVKTPLTMKYTVCTGHNILEAHQMIQKHFFELPTSTPAERMLLYPLWSTWAQYHSGINQSIVLDYSRQVIRQGFSLSSHIEIDDNWEPCYGQVSFHPDKFPDPKAMVDEIKGMGLNVTVWVVPFVNYECPLFQEGLEKDYFVRDKKGKTGIASSWVGSNAGAIDMTNPDAVEWWQARLQKLQQETGIDAFKFDAGETNWLPYHPVASPKFDGDHNLMPNVYTTKFVEACSKFGGMIETRAAHRNHKHGIFIRMMDKDSNWGYGNGLRSVIPTLFHFGILGYPYVLPDMIGGNAYGGRPSKELYIRWMQLNVLMPSVQISIVPWDFDEETVKLTQEVLAIRNEFNNEILQAAKQATEDGSPMNRPLWWLDPEDEETFIIDSEYTLGNDIIVAPVLDEGALSRAVYLPAGTWAEYPVDENSKVFEGPISIKSYPAPLNKVPIFIRQ